MKKLLKSKEHRDTLLLIAMALIFILFLVYLFVPLGRQSSESDPSNLNRAGDKLRNRMISRVLS